MLIMLAKAIYNAYNTYCIAHCSKIRLLLLSLKFWLTTERCLWDERQLFYGTFPVRTSTLSKLIDFCVLLHFLERNDDRPLLRGETWLLMMCLMTIGHLSFESRIYSRVNRARCLSCRSKCWIACLSSRDMSGVLFSSCACLRETQVMWIALISQRLSHSDFREWNARRQTGIQMKIKHWTL